MWSTRRTVMTPILRFREGQQKDLDTTTYFMSRGANHHGGDDGGVQQLLFEGFG